MPHPKTLFPSLVMILPLLLLYQAGLWATGYRMVNGVDFISGSLYRMFDLRGLLIFNLAATVLTAGGVFYLRKETGFSVRRFLVPAMVESVVYALLMGTVITFVLRKTVPFGSFDPSLDPLQKLTLSVGAGVNEELFFRVFLFGLIYFLALDVLDLGRWGALAAGVVLSSLLFSYAHYVGPSAAYLDKSGFLYRFVAGVLFCLLYRFRSLAVAVYTHTIYDLLIMFS